MTGDEKVFQQNPMIITLRVEFAPLIIQHQGDVQTHTLLNRLLAGQKRLEECLMNITEALDLLSTNVDDLDASIQKEIADFEALKNSQGGVLTPDQQAKFDALIARIQNQKTALDADNAV